MDTAWSANGRRQIANLILKYQPSGKLSQGRPLEIPPDRFMRPEQVTKRTTCKLYDYVGGGGDDDNDDEKSFLIVQWGTLSHNWR